MEKRKGSGSSPSALNQFLKQNPDPYNIKVNGLKDYTWEEISKHNTVEDAWTVYGNKVYNITYYLKYHPGGVDIMKSVLGKDCQAQFMKFHGYLKIDNFIKPFQIGTVKE